MPPREITEHIEDGTLAFDAFSDHASWNTFGLYISKVEVPVAVIRSTAPNKLRIFKGYGEKIADQRLNHQGRILWNFEGIQQIMIVWLNEEGKALDMSIFKGRIVRGMDAQLYTYLMESIEVEVIDFVV